MIWLFFSPKEIVFKISFDSVQGFNGEVQHVINVESLFLLVENEIVIIAGVNQKQANYNAYMFHLL